MRDWRFKTLKESYWASYYEEWRAGPDRREHYLFRAYFALYQMAAGKEREILALHTDPNEPEGPHSEYKRGPHLHISWAEHPIPRAHIALNLDNLEATLSSVDTLTQAMTTALRLVREQVLELLQGAAA